MVTEQVLSQVNSMCESASLPTLTETQLWNRIFRLKKANRIDAGKSRFWPNKLTEYLASIIDSDKSITPARLRQKAVEYFNKSPEIVVPSLDRIRACKHAYLHRE